MFFLHLTVTALMGTIIFVTTRSDARIFGRCELADKLITHNIDHHLIPQWLCITENESRRQTNVTRISHNLGLLNGIFQINNRVWCAPGGPNVCNVLCSKLRDDDIGDDIECAKMIHKRQGFRAWDSYTRTCKNADLESFLNNCRK